MPMDKMELNSFALNAPRVDIAATASSQRIALPQGDGGRTLRICNTGSAWVFGKGGDVTVTASATTDTPFGPGAIETFTLGQGDTHVAAICSSGSSATITIQRGVGQ